MRLRGKLPPWLRARIKLFLAVTAMGLADSIVPDPKIDARVRMDAANKGRWLVRNAVRLHKLIHPVATP